MRDVTFPNWIYRISIKTSIIQITNSNYHQSQLKILLNLKGLASIVWKAIKDKIVIIRDLYKVSRGNNRNCSSPTMNISSA